MPGPASKILMVTPRNFGYNPETAESNAFQQELNLEAGEVKKLASAEFAKMVSRLESLDVDVVVIDPGPDIEAPDAVFPNNVFTTHEDGTLCIYPMEAPARRLERSILESVSEHFEASRIVDLTRFENEGKFLEGTGSLVLDRLNRIAFACLSSRTNREVLEAWCTEMDYEPFLFTAVDESGKEIYHTNVMMCLGTGFAVACMESIRDSNERANFTRKIHQTKRELVSITLEQMNRFAGNMLEIADRSGNSILVMSENAHRSLSEEQLAKLAAHSRIEAFDIETIEACGGGSVRCMIAELY